MMMVTLLGNGGLEFSMKFISVNMINFFLLKGIAIMCSEGINLDMGSIGRLNIELY